MSIKRLKTPSADTLNNFPQSDVRSGNNSTQRISPNGDGYTTKGTVYVDWPYDPSANKDDGEVNPGKNPVVPPRLTNGNKLNTGLTG